ncbi:MAG: ABC transporter permease, partial [Acidobacteriaceae bacterium]|nr:ABC transporter permease [Acidobacteriaceae bacterium]
MDTLFKDLQYALRDLLKSRGFSIVAVLTLALGIGGPTAMFSVIKAVVLRPLPFNNPDRLVQVQEYDVRRRSSQFRFSYPDFADVRARNHSFASIAAYTDDEVTATGFGEPRHVGVEKVTPGLFEMLGVHPSLGRSFQSEEDQPGHHVAVLSDAFWRGRFHADPKIVGRSIALNGRQFTIVGVMPRGFQFPILSEGRDMWLTFSRSSESDEPGDTPMTAQRGNHGLQVIASLKRGVSLPVAIADLGSIAHALGSTYPGTNRYSGIRA